MAEKSFFIANLPRDGVVTFLALVRQKELKPKRNGGVYLQLVLSDRTGGRTGVAEQFQACLNHRKILAQESHVSLSEPKRAGFEDSVIRPVFFAKPRGIRWDRAMGISMLRLYGVPAFPPYSGHIHKIRVRRKELAERVHVVVVPSCGETRRQRFARPPRIRRSLVLPLVLTCELQ